MKYAFIQRRHKVWPIYVRCRVLDVRKISGLPETGSFVADMAQMLWVAFGGINAIEVNLLVADHAGGVIGRCRINPTRGHGVFGVGHKEGARWGSLYRRVKCRQPRSIT